jgi:hypothetical protein
MAHMEHRIRHPKQVSVHNLRSSFTRQAQTNHDDRRIQIPKFAETVSVFLSVCPRVASAVCQLLQNRAAEAS